MNEFILLTVLFVAPPPPLAGFEEDLIYQGRSLRDWLVDFRGNDPVARRRASRVLRLVGPEAHEAVPALLMALKVDDGVARQRLSRALARIGPRALPLLTAALSFEDARIGQGAGRALVFLGKKVKPSERALARQLKSTNADVRIFSAVALWQGSRKTAGLDVLRASLSGASTTKQWGAWGLMHFGRAAAPATPDLIRLLADRDDYVREWTFRALTAIGPEAVLALVKSSTSNVPGVRVESAEALGRMGPQADSALPALLGLLKDSSPGPRIAAARAIGRIAPESETAVKGLRESLRDSENDLRLESARALGALGKNSSPAIPELRIAVKDPVRSVRRAAATALVRIGKPAIHALVELLKEDDHLVRRQALLALRDLGPDAAPALSALQAALEDPTVSLRPLAIDALGAIGPTSAPALASALSAGVELRKPAALALARLGSSAAPAREALTRALLDKSPEVRQAVVAALGAIGPGAKAAVPALVKLYDDEPALRAEVMAALVRIQPEAKDAVPLFRKALADGNVSVRLRALSGLVALGAESKPAVAEIAARLKDGNSNVRKQSALALALLGAGKQALPAIKEGLAAADAADRETALWMVGALGKTAKDILPTVRAALKDDNVGVRLMALWVLADLEQFDKPALGTLVELLKDPARLADRHSVLRLLARLGPEAKPALPDLLSLVEQKSDLSLRIESARVLGAIGPDARESAPALLKLLRDIDLAKNLDVEEISDALDLGKPGEARINRLAVLADSDFNRDVARAFLKMKERALYREMEHITSVAAKQSSILQEEVLAAIEKIGPAAVPAARAGLTNVRVGARIQAARLLARLGPRARDAVADLRLALKDPSPAVAVEVAAALNAVAGERESLVDVLMGAFDEPGETPVRAAAILGRLGTGASKSVPALRNALRSQNDRERQEAARALAAIRPDTKAVREALRKRLRDSHFGVRVQSALALRSIDAKFDPAPILVAVLRSADSPDVILDCIEALSGLGEDARPALPFVLPLRANPADRVRTAAARLTWKLTRDSGAVLPVLVGVAGNAGVSSSVRVMALKTLAEMGKEARLALLDLALIERDPTATEEVRLQARESAMAVRR